MTSADAMRASDSDREKVVQALQEQVGEGRLTLAEFEQRSSEAYATAKTVGDLRELTNDLPVDPLAPPKPQLASWQQPWPFPPATVPPMSQWQQRTFPPDQQNRGPLRRVHPMRIAVAAILLIWAIGAVVSVVAHVPFAWPVLAVFFFVFARGGGGRRRRYYR
jgi:hypothetical protein